MKNLVINSIFVGALTLLFACGKQVMTPEPSLRLTDGHLVFANELAYDKTMEEMQSDAKHDMIQSQFPAFISMKKAFETISEQDQAKIGGTLDLSGYEGFLTIHKEKSGELSADIVVDDPYLNQILDKNGMIQIGSKWIKYTETHKLEVENPDDSQIAQLRSYQDGKTVPAFAKATSYKALQSNDTRCGNTQGEAYYTHGGKSKRIVGQTLIVSLSCCPGQFVRAVTKHQVKNVGIWWADEASQLGISSTGTICFQSGTCTNQFLPVGGSSTTNPVTTVYNVNKTEWDVNSNMPLGDGNGQFHVYTSHKVKCDDNVFRTAYSDNCY